MPVLSWRRARASTATFTPAKVSGSGIVDYWRGDAKMRGSIMKRRDVLPLESVLEEPVSFEADLAVPLTAIDREPLVALSPLALSGEARRIEGGYALDARLGYSGELECSRCLNPYPFHE